MNAKLPFWVSVQGFVRLVWCKLFHRGQSTKADEGWPTIDSKGDYHDMHCLRCNRFWRKPL
jgi:hypothetical protein